MKIITKSEWVRWSELNPRMKNHRKRCARHYTHYAQWLKLQNRHDQPFIAYCRLWAGNFPKMIEVEF